ncbi:MAG: site-specific DNA-methyltransferase, partial [Dehalococcoidia bacterium]
VTLTDPPYARDVYQRLGMPNTKPGSGTPARLVGKAYAYSSAAAPRSGTPRTGISNHQYSSVSIERLAAGAIGSIDEMLEDVAREIAHLTARWSLVFSDVETCHRWREQLELVGLRYVRTGAWVKDDPMPQFSGDRPAVGFEPCTIVHARGPMRWNGGGHPAVWHYGTVKRNRPDHPCPKPLALMRELVRLFSDPGETILDCFAGSGTTLIAARIEGRKAIGIECNEAYAEVAARRLERGDVGARQMQQGMFALDEVAS